MKRILIVNGPNLNLLGTREPHIYGSVSMEEYLTALRTDYRGHEIDCYQSNHEGDIVDRLQEAGTTGEVDGIVLNAAAYTHTSLAIADAVAAIEVPVVEVHISNIYAREPFRRRSLLAPVAKGVITGFGLDSYRLAVDALINM